MGEPAPRPPTAGEIRAHVDGWCGGVMYCAICLHQRERRLAIADRAEGRTPPEG